MASNAVTDIVVRESGRFLGEEIYRRTFGVSPWMTLMPRGVYPMGLSQTINVLTYERTAPQVAEPTWAAITVVDGQEGGSCIPVADTLEIGSTTRNFQLYRRALQGPRFCAEEARSVFELEQQLSAITGVLTDYTRIEWEIRDRHEYFRSCMWKVVVNSSNPANSGGESSTGPGNDYPAVGPTMPLSMAQLNAYGTQLLREGAAGSALVKSNGAPLLTVVCSRETAGNIIRQNYQLRQDINYASMGSGDASIFMKQFGIQHEYGGFMFLVDMFPRRFTYSNGTYTEVPAFDKTSATKGNRAFVRAAYRTAPFEESFIFDPTTMTQLVPQPITNPAPNFRFDPITYTGEWKVQNILNEDTNPDGNILRHRGILMAASMPVHPERGVAFVHLRCDPEGAVAVCNS